MSIITDGCGKRKYRIPKENLNLQKHINDLESEIIKLKNKQPTQIGIVKERPNR